MQDMRSVLSRYDPGTDITKRIRGKPVCIRDGATAHETEYHDASHFRSEPRGNNGFKLRNLTRMRVRNHEG